MAVLINFMRRETLRNLVPGDVVTFLSNGNQYKVKSIVSEDEIELLDGRIVSRIQLKDIPDKCLTIKFRGEKTLVSNGVKKAEALKSPHDEPDDCLGAIVGILKYYGKPITLKTFDEIAHKVCPVPQDLKSNEKETKKTESKKPEKPNKDLKFFRVKSQGFINYKCPIGWDVDLCDCNGRPLKTGDVVGVYYKGVLENASVVTLDYMQWLSKSGTSDKKDYLGDVVGYGHIDWNGKDRNKYSLVYGWSIGDKTHIASKKQYKVKQYTITFDE